MSLLHVAPSIGTPKTPARRKDPRNYSLNLERLRGLSKSRSGDVLTTEEIAEGSGMTPMNVRRTLDSALRKLRSGLASDAEVPALAARIFRGTKIREIPDVLSRLAATTTASAPSRCRKR